jgi:hypothetical protein
MVSQVVFAQGWLLKPLFRIVDQLSVCLPCTPYVIKLRCFFKDLLSFVIHASSSCYSHFALMNLEIIGASCLVTGLPSRSSSKFSLVISFRSRVRAHPI